MVPFYDYENALRHFDYTPRCFHRLFGEKMTIYFMVYRYPQIIKTKPLLHAPVSLQFEKMMTVCIDKA